MKKSTKIILVTLLAQTFIGAVVTTAAFEEFPGAMGGIGIAMSYVIAFIVCILISVGVLTLALKQPAKVVSKAILFSICLWILGPICIARIAAIIPDEKYSEYYEKTFITPTLKAVKEMGFRKYKWDDYRGACLVRLPDGRIHYLGMNNGYLNIYTQVKEPSMNDTVGWMRTALLEAMVYIKPKYNLVLSSSIDKKEYEFKRINNNLSSVLKLGSGNPYDPPENWIEGETIGKDPNRNKLGNIRIGFYYLDQIQKKE